jgi:hypothetical protein
MSAASGLNVWVPDFGVRSRCSDHGSDVIST